MKIIITMAGLGSRFKKIGINKPKHEIIAKDKSLFEWSMLSLKDFFEDSFVFIVREGNYNKAFIEEKCEKLGISKYNIVPITQITDGQATTAILSDKYVDDDDEIAVYNIDTYVEPYEIKKADIKECNFGFIPVFNGDGDKWSFVKTDNLGNVIQVSEKIRISDFATIGFYYFKTWKLYKEVYGDYKNNIIKNFKEAYIAPMYKGLIDKDMKIGIALIDKEKIHVLGTPEDIREFDKDWN